MVNDGLMMVNNDDLTELHLMMLNGERNSV